MMNLHHVLLLFVLGAFERAGTLHEPGESDYHNQPDKLNTKLDSGQVVPDTLNSYDSENNHTNDITPRKPNITMMSYGNHFPGAPPHNSEIKNLININRNNIIEQGKSRVQPAPLPYIYVIMNGYTKETTTTEEPTTDSSDNVMRFSRSHTRELELKKNPTEATTKDSSKNATKFSKTTKGSLSHITHDVASVINNLTTVNTNFWGNGTTNKSLETTSKSDSDTSNSTATNSSNVVYSCQGTNKLFYGKGSNSTDGVKKSNNFIFYPCSIYDILTAHLSEIMTTTEAPSTVSRMHPFSSLVTRHSRSPTRKPKIKKQPSEMTTVSSSSYASNFSKILNAGISHFAHDIAAAINNLTSTYINKIPAIPAKPSNLGGNGTVNASVNPGKFGTNGAIKPAASTVIHSLSPGEHKASAQDVRLP